MSNEDKMHQKYLVSCRQDHSYNKIPFLPKKDVCPSITYLTFNNIAKLSETTHYDLLYEKPRQDLVY